MHPVRASRLLGVPVGASESEVTEAFKRLVWTAHPDHGGSTADFAALSEARAVLLGPSTTGRSLPGSARAGPTISGRMANAGRVIVVADVSLLRQAVDLSVKWWTRRRVGAPRRVI